MQFFLDMEIPTTVVRSLFSSPSERAVGIVDEDSPRPTVTDSSPKLDGDSDDENVDKKAKGMELCKAAMESPICIKQHVEEVHEVARMLQPVTRGAKLTMKEVAIIGDNLLNMIWFVVCDGVRIGKFEVQAKFG